MSDALLTVNDLSLSYGSQQVVHDVGFTVGRGEIVGLVGESGSGKTTIGRAITGLITPTAGTIAWRGEPLPIRRNAALRRQIQLVYQDPYLSLNPALTVTQTLAELLRAQGVSKGNVQGAVTDLLARVSLPAEVGPARPAQLSGGMRQRVAIARALAVEPQLIVADEPTSALDVSVQAAMLELFSQLRRDLGTAFVIISHDLGVIEALCDSVIVLQHGRVIEYGPATQVLGDPQAAYTRELLAAVPRLPTDTWQPPTPQEGSQS